MKIRDGSIPEAVDLAKQIPDFTNPYGLNEPDTPLPQLDHVLIAEDDGIAVGFRAGYRHSADTFAVWLAGVLPGYRRQGIGGALYRAQKAWLKSRGYRFLRTHVRNSNRVMIKILVAKDYHVIDVVRYGDVRRNKVVFLKNLWDRDAPMNAATLVVGLLKSGEPGTDQDLQAWLRDITISWLRFKYSGRIIEGSSVNIILDQACESRHQYCLILTPGDIVSHAWELGFVKTIEEWALERDFLVAGNIPRRESACRGVSPRGLLVNLDHYRNLANPAFGIPGDAQVEVTLPAPPSDGTPEGDTPDGDDEVLMPGGGRALRTPVDPGWNLVSASLAAGLKVYSLPRPIASTLLFIAPEDDCQADRLRTVQGEGIATATLVPGDLGAGQLKFLTGVQRQVQNSRRGIFVWNFENYDDVNAPPAGFHSPVSTLYSVAAGLKTSWILQTHGFDDNTRLVYFDYSEQALRFKKMLHEEWNGEDYPEFLRYLFTRIEPGEAFYQLWGGFSPQDMAWDVVHDAWTREITRWGGEAVIKDNWTRARKLRVDYVLCNILDNQGPLIEQIDGRPNSVIWWSNVFFTFFSNWSYRIDARRAIYERFLRQLTQRDPGIFMYGKDYNNMAVDGVPAAEYSRVYFQVEDSELEPREIRSKFD